MPIENYRFRRFEHGGPLKPLLPVRISNPYNTNEEFFETLGLIDTGADECSLPAYIAELIGHDLRKVKPIPFEGATGTGVAYPHTTTIEITIPKIGLILPEMKIDYVEGLPCVLLGVRGFLERHILKIDYTKRLLSIKRPEKYIEPYSTP